MPIYLWSNQEIFMYWTCGPRMLRIYRWLKDYNAIEKKNDIAALWSCSGRPGASLLGQDVVASLLNLCMAKWLRKWRRSWLYVRSNTKNAKSLMLSALNMHEVYTVPIWNMFQKYTFQNGTPCKSETCFRTDGTQHVSKNGASGNVQYTNCSIFDSSFIWSSWLPISF